MSNHELLQEYIRNKKPSKRSADILYISHAISVAAAGYCEVINGLTGVKMLPVYAGSAAFYITGRVLDRASTLYCLKIIQKAESLGIETNVVETNPNVSARPSAAEFLGPKKVSKDVWGLVNAIIIHPIQCSTWYYIHSRGDS